MIYSIKSYSIVLVAFILQFRVFRRGFPGVGVFFGCMPS